MTRAKKIRDGLFSVSWIAQDVYLCQPSNQEVVYNLQQHFKSCTLVCQMELVRFQDGTMNPVLILKMETTGPPLDSLRGIVVTANYDGVKQEMKLNESVWRTVFWYSDTMDAYDHLFEERQMANDFPFEILIDFKPNSVVSLKKGSKHVLEHLAKLWENKTLSDVTFKCGNESIKGHTMILASGSPVLAAMFQNDFKENQTRIVLINDTKAKVLENLFRYIYVGECPLLENGDQDGSGGVVDLFVAADKYAVDSLKEECALNLSQTLAIENAAKYLVLAHLHNSSELHESALNFMVKNAKAVCSRKDWMEIIKNYPELCFQATQLMVHGF